MILALVRSVRPKQWVKNAFVGAPLIFANRLLDPRSALRAAAAVAIFCLISSAVYLWNDIADVDKDRAHPKKRNRAIASGELPIDVARGFAGVFAALGLALGTWLGWGFVAVATTYLIQNVLYSRTLKHVAYVDVLVISAGFLLRVGAGALAIGVHASPWIFLCTGLLAAFNGFGKRVHEMQSETGAASRAVLESYHPGQLKAALYVTGVATVASFLCYTLADPHPALFSTRKLLWTMPLIVVGVGRFMHLVSSRPHAESPTEEMMRDPLFVGTVAVWATAVVGIIYFAR